MAEPLGTVQPTSLDRLFGVPTYLDIAEAQQFVTGLRASLARQFASVDANAPLPATLEATLGQLRQWFDPVAKGERLRRAMNTLPAGRTRIPYANTSILLDVPDPHGELDAGQSRQLVTPEGCVVLHCFQQELQRLDNDGRACHDDTYVRLAASQVETALVVLTDTYRSWSQARIRQTIALLTSEPSTLRPAAAGLLLVLLINRNTAADRALPRPRDPRVLDLVSDAIGRPALAYAQTLTGTDKATAAGVDLYRGWALGELTRRLGPSMHTGLDEGIYLDPDAEQSAVTRLAEDIARRTTNARRRVPAAVDAALSAYDIARPTLAGLSLAYDRPSNTRRIRERLVAAADAGTTSTT